jgi:peptidoglycan hydrolase-like protein with peptidoglycan-binding domain
MHKFTTIAAALAVGAVWTLAPAAFAADTAGDKVDRAADKVERGAEKAADKAVDAKDKVKEKVHRTTDKVRAKTERMNDRVAMADTRAAQEALKTQGFDPGPIDGLMGPRTRTALMDYQRKNDLPSTGMLDEATMAKLNVRTSRSNDVPAASPVTQPDPKKQNP